MDIGTAKPTPAERAEVPHHLLDVGRPDRGVHRRPLPAGLPRRARRHRGARPAGAARRRHRALPPGRDRRPRHPRPVPRGAGRARGRARHRRRSTRRLARLDPVAAARMEPTNRRRVVRALEVTLGSGRPFSSFGPGLGDYPPSRFALLGVWLPRPVVAERIARRYADQVAAGFVDEVRGLAAAGARPHRPARPSATRSCSPTWPASAPLDEASTSPCAAPAASPAASGSGSSATPASPGSAPATTRWSPSPPSTPKSARCGRA